MGRLDQKVALVTGGASGLGKAIARQLAGEGACVTITDVQVHAGCAAATEGKLTFLEQDVCDEARWNEIISETEARFGRLNILVNNAGIVGPVDAFTPEATRLADWRQIFAINVEGVLLGCRAAIPALRRTGGGVIINMSSIAGLVSMPEGVAYGASKAAVAHITRSVALYCARIGSKIRCNSIHPGNVLTPLLEQVMQGIAKARGAPYEHIFNEFRNESPMGEFQEPEDIAHAVVFLASDEARYITGARLVIDGGTTLSVG